MTATHAIAPTSQNGTTTDTADLTTITITIPEAANVKVSIEQIGATYAPLITELATALAVTRTHIADLTATCHLFEQQVAALKAKLPAGGG